MLWSPFLSQTTRTTIWVRVRNGTPFTNQMSVSTIQQNDTDWGFQVADATQNICPSPTAEGPSAPTLTLPIHMHTSCIRQAGTRRQTIQMGLSAGPPLWRSSLSCVLFCNVVDKPNEVLMRWKLDHRTGPPSDLAAFWAKGGGGQRVLSRRPRLVQAERNDNAVERAFSSGPCVMHVWPMYDSIESVPTPA